MSTTDSFSFPFHTPENSGNQDNLGRGVLIGKMSLVGPKGDTGLGAYETWIAAGNAGTYQDFLQYIASLVKPVFREIVLNASDFDKDESPLDSEVLARAIELVALPGDTFTYETPESVLGNSIGKIIYQWDVVEGINVVRRNMNVPIYGRYLALSEVSAGMHYKVDIGDGLFPHQYLVNSAGNPVELYVNSSVNGEGGGVSEGTNLLSTGETGGTKYLREDGDGTSSWQLIPSAGDALTSDNLSQFATTSSAELASVLSDETGSGSAVFRISPSLITPNLGVPSFLVGTNITGTASGLTVGATEGVEAGATADQTGAEMAVAIDAEPGLEILTTAERDKLAGLEEGKFKGRYTAADFPSALALLTTAFPTPANGSIAEISDGATVKAAVWNTTTNIWEEDAAATTGETSASIKSKYESNANTNPFTDANLTKLTGIEAAATGDQTGSEIKALYELEPNAFTDAQFTKLAGLNSADYATTAQGVLADTALQSIPGTYVDTYDPRLVDARVPLTHTHIKSSITDFNDSDYATAAQGTLADSALQSVPANYVDTTDARLSDARTPVAHTHTKADITDFVEGDYATAAQGTLAASALQSVPANYVVTTDSRLTNARTPVTHTHTKASISDFVEGDYATSTALADILAVIYENIRVTASLTNTHSQVHEGFFDDNGVLIYRYDFDLLDENYIDSLPSEYAGDAEYLAWQLRHEGEVIFWHQGISPYLRKGVHTVKTTDANGFIERWDVIDFIPQDKWGNHPSLISMAPYYRKITSENVTVVVVDTPPVATTPQINLPTPDSIISGSSATFEWAANGVPLQAWILRIGSSLGGVQHHSGAQLDDLILSEAVTTLPADGSTIYVRIGYKTMEGPWVFVDTTYINNA